MHGIVLVDSAGAQTIEYHVIDGAGDNVVDNSGNPVVAFLQSSTTVAPTFKFLVSYVSGSRVFTMADNINTGHQDWASVNPVDYESYLITGYKIRGEGSRKFQANVVDIYNNGLGAVDWQGVWDFATSGNTGKFTSRQRINFSDSGYSNLRKRLKIRGNGRTLQYKISSVNASPFDLIGWSSLETGNAKP